MTSDRKLIWAVWLGRFCLLFGTLGCLFAAYMSSFVESDIAKSSLIITVALMSSILFFSSFPWHRMNIRFSQIERELSERTNLHDASPAQAPIQNDVRGCVKFQLAIAVLMIFVMINLLLAIRAYFNNDHIVVFSHVVVTVAAFLVSDTLISLYKVDETFGKIGGLISLHKKNQAPKKAGELSAD